VAQTVGDLFACAESPNEHPVVRDSSAWALGQVAAQYPEILLQDAATVTRTFSLVATLVQSGPTLAERALVIAHSLAVTVETDDVDSPPTNALSGGYVELVGHIGAIVEDARYGDDVRNLAQETLNVLIHGAARDCVPFVQNMFPTLVRKLQTMCVQRVVTRHRHGRGSVQVGLTLRRVDGGDAQAGRAHQASGREYPSRATPSADRPA
jgi:hypothetical protein